MRGKEESAMKKNNRVLALWIAVVVCSVMLLSAVFIISEAGHDCIGEGCPVCCQISICEHTLKTLSNVVITMAPGIVLASSFLICHSVFLAGGRMESLVTLKVKLSN